MAPQGAGGGASFELTKFATVSSSRFTLCNSSYSGGALSFWHGGGAVSSSSFLSCSALRGGAVTIEGGPKDDVCDALGAAGDWCLYAPVSFRDCDFTGNAALTDGGGALEVISGGSAHLDACRLLNNTAATGSGGAVYCRSDQQRVVLHNSTLSGNAAARCGGIAAETAALVELADTELSFNAATDGDGGGLCYAQPPLQESLHSCVSGIVRELSYPTGCDAGFALPIYTWGYPPHGHFPLVSGRTLTLRSCPPAGTSRP